MAKKETMKKRKPQDATLRNVRAASKRITALEKRVKKLEQWCKALTEDVAEIWKHTGMAKHEIEI